MVEDTKPLSLTRSLGFSFRILHGVVNLTVGDRHAVCYPAGHTLIYYDEGSRHQRALQGHANSITCTCASPDKTLLVSADEGPGALIIVWDMPTFKPIRTLAIPEGAIPGCRSLDMSHDGRFLAALTSAPANPAAADQLLCVWDLARDEDAPIVQHKVGTADPHVLVRFKPWSSGASPAAGASLADDVELVTNGRATCLFWSTSFHAEKGTKLVRTEPSIRREDFADFGEMTCSIFVPETTKALTGTSNGDVIVWELESVLHGGPKEVLTRQAVQVMRLHVSPITCLAVSGPRVVSAGTDGFVRFYDRKLKLEAWFEHLGAGGITSLSFDSVMVDSGLPLARQKTRVDGDSALSRTPLSHAPSMGLKRLKSTISSGPQSKDKDEPMGASLALNLFSAPDFVVGTLHGKVVRVSASQFKSSSPSEPSLQKEILAGVSGPVAALATHPLLNKLTLVTSRGTLEQWDLDTYTRFAYQEQPKRRGSALAYAGDGRNLGVGFLSGHVLIKDDESLNDVVSFRNTSVAIAELRFTGDGQYLAYVDAALTLGVYARTQIRGVTMWEFVGKYRIAQEGPVRLAVQGPPEGEESNEPARIFTAGPDGRVSEFEVNRTRPREGVRLVGSTKLQLAGRASALCMAPRGLTKCQSSSGPALVHADDLLKIHIVDPDGKRKTATIAGPSYAADGIHQFAPFASLPLGDQPARPYLAFALPRRIVGLLGSPVEVRPDPSVGVLAHPGIISGLAVSGKKDCLVTSSAEDSIVHVWRIDFEAFDGALDRQHGSLGSRPAAAAAAEGSSSGEAAGPSPRSAPLAAPAAVGPWIRALEGGEGGEVHQLLKDYFYYALIAEQGEDSDRPRAVAQPLPVRRLPDLLRSLGCLLDEAQVRELLIDFRERQTSRGLDPTCLTLEELAEFYTCYRPMRAVDEKDVHRALLELKAVTQHGHLGAARLVQALTAHGEAMSEQELADYLADMLGIEDRPEDTKAEDFLKLLDEKTLMQALGLTAVE